VVSVVNDTADFLMAVSMKLLIEYDTADHWTSKFDLLWLLLNGISIKK
jgi:hypothetical protein